MYTIALDAMGGDNAPQAVVEGAKLAVAEFPDVAIQLYGPEDVLKPLVGGAERVEIINAPDVIGMHDSPMLAVRQKVDSSMVKAVMAVREGKADAVVSAGSTGALLAGGMLRIGRIRGVERPALAPVIPGRKKPFLLIDCGANVDCQARYLQQFGLMGAVYMQSVQGVARPEVGLANIGTEAEKGDKLTREAYELMSQTDGLRLQGQRRGARRAQRRLSTSWWPTALSATSSSRPSRAFPASSWACSRDGMRSSRPRPRRRPDDAPRPARPQEQDGLYKSHGGAPLLGA